MTVPPTPSPTHGRPHRMRSWTRPCRRDRHERLGGLDWRRIQNRPWRTWPFARAGDPLPPHRPSRCGRRSGHLDGIECRPPRSPGRPSRHAALGVAAVLLLVAGSARSPLRGVTSAVDEPPLGRSGASTPPPSSTAGSPAFAGRAGRRRRQAVTWATRLGAPWTGSSFPSPRPSAGTIGGTAPTRASSPLVAGPRSAPSARSRVRPSRSTCRGRRSPARRGPNSPCVTLVEALRLQGEDVPGPNVGRRPDSGPPGPGSSPTGGPSTLALRRSHAGRLQGGAAARAV